MGGALQFRTLLAVCLVALPWLHGGAAYPVLGVGTHELFTSADGWAFYSVPTARVNRSLTFRLDYPGAYDQTPADKQSSGWRFQMRVVPGNNSDASGRTYSGDKDETSILSTIAACDFPNTDYLVAVRLGYSRFLTGRTEIGGIQYSLTIERGTENCLQPEPEGDDLTWLQIVGAVAGGLLLICCCCLGFNRKGGGTGGWTCCDTLDFCCCGCSCGDKS